MSPFQPMWVELYSGHSKWYWLRPIEYFLAFAGWSHSEWDHLSPLGVELSGGHSKWDQLSPSLATAKYGHSKWVHFSPFETHRDQMSPQVAHWVPFRFHSVGRELRDGFRGSWPITEKSRHYMMCIFFHSRGEMCHWALIKIMCHYVC